MKFGMLYEIETPRPWSALSEDNIYWQALAQIELADRIGATHTLGSRRPIPAEAGFAV